MAELKRKIHATRENLVEKEHDGMVEVTALLGCDPKSFKRERRSRP